jgi:hypothetical protein
MKIDANGVRTDDIPDRAPLQHATIYARRLGAARAQVITETADKLVEVLAHRSERGRERDRSASVR